MTKKPSVTVYFNEDDPVLALIKSFPKLQRSEEIRRRLRISFTQDELVTGTTAANLPAQFDFADKEVSILNVDTLSSSIDIAPIPHDGRIYALEEQISSLAELIDGLTQRLDKKVSILAPNLSTPAEENIDTWTLERTSHPSSKFLFQTIQDLRSELQSLRFQQAKQAELFSIIKKDATEQADQITNLQYELEEIADLRQLDAQDLADVAHTYPDLVVRVNKLEEASTQQQSTEQSQRASPVAP